MSDASAPVGAQLARGGDPPEAAGGEDAYGPLEMPDAWHVLSLAFFAVALASRLVASALPFDLAPRGLWRPLVPAALSFGAGVLGALAALPGVFRGARRRAARFALFLNLAVVALTALAALAVLVILRRI